jgi:hypothetical protein
MASAVPSLVESSRARAFSASAQENLEDGKSVPRRLEPSRAVSFMARLKPCHSSRDVLQGEMESMP